MPSITKLWARMKIFYRDVFHFVSVGVFSLGMIMSILGVTKVWIKNPPVLLKTWASAVGNWAICFVVVGFILTAFGGFYLGDNILKRLEFNRLISTTSKEKFIKNLDRIEELAYRLSTKHERRVMKRKKKFGL